MTRWYRIRRVSSWIVVGTLAFPAVSRAQPADTLTTRLAPLAFLLGGEWVAETPQPFGDGRMFTPTIRYESMLNGQVLRGVMTWVFEDGERRTSWEAFTYYHPGREQVVHQGLWASGMVVEGRYDTLRSTDSLRLDFTVHWPAGSEAALPTDWYSIDRPLDPDRYEEIAYMRVEGAWRQNIRLVYARRRER